MKGYGVKGQGPYSALVLLTVFSRPTNLRRTDRCTIILATLSPSVLLFMGIKYHLLTESEVSMGKSLSQTLMY